MGRGIRDGIWCGWCARGLLCGEKKFVLVKNDMTRNMNASCAKVEAPIPLVLERVAEKNARGGAWRKFMWSEVAKIGKAEAPKDA